MGYNMIAKTTEAVGRAWKFDNKYIWSILFFVGSLLGYSIPETLEGYVPFADKAQVQSIDNRVTALEDSVFGSKREEQPVEPPATPTPVKKKINVEGY
jgi:hypothetical protein